MKDLKDLNIHERDKRINFNEEDHIYTIDGNKNAKSVTQLISEFFPKFDKNYWANNESRKTGEKVEDILKRWAELGDKARNEGTNLHNQIENFYNEKILNFKNNKNGFYVDLGYELLAEEDSLHSYKSTKHSYLIQLISPDKNTKNKRS